MKVLYDNQVFTWQKCGGISRSFIEIIKNLDTDIEYKLPILFSNNIYLKNLDFVNTMSLFPNTNFYGKDKLLKIPNTLIAKNELRKEFDVFHPTYFDTYFLKYIGNKPFVLTIHDMIPEKFPEFFPANNQIQIKKRLLAERANKIIAVSESTKIDIIQCYNIDPEKIHVVYHGSSMTVNKTHTLNLPDKYILYVGLRDDYKNFRRFLESFVMLSSYDPDIKLVCTGAPFNLSELDYFKEKGIVNQIAHFFVNDMHLSELYSRALFFVFPSLSEGFGIPILEAFASGCPILISKIDCFEEIAKDAAIYFDPYSVNSIFESMIYLIHNDNKRKLLIQLGYDRVKEFEWSNSGTKISKIYKNL